MGSIILVLILRGASGLRINYLHLLVIIITLHHVSEERINAWVTAIDLHDFHLGRLSRRYEWCDLLALAALLILTAFAFHLVLFLDAIAFRLGSDMFQALLLHPLGASSSSVACFILIWRAVSALRAVIMAIEVEN